MVGLGLRGFFRGIGPALGEPVSFSFLYGTLSRTLHRTVLVINPVIQYSVFEQLKNILASRRKLRRKGGLTDWDFFVLGAISKLGNSSKKFLRAIAMLIHRTTC